MKHRNGYLVALALGALAAAAAGAQTQPDRDVERARQDAERAQAEAARELQRAEAEVATAQREAHREAQQANAEARRAQAESYREVARAREELEKAARDLARLSAENGDFSRFIGQIRQIGGRAPLGVNVETDGSDFGVRVVGVTPNGPAAAAGVVVGDTIVAIDGTDLSGKGPPSPAERLFAQTRDLEPGQQIDLRLLRDGDYRDVQVQLRERGEGVWVVPPGSSGFRYVVPAAPAAPAAPGAPAVSVVPGGRMPWIVGSPFYASQWGDLELLALTPGLGSYFGVVKGLLVVRAPTDAALALREGDVILDISGREPTSTAHALRILSSFEPGETMRVTIMRQRERQTLEVKVPEGDAAVWVGTRR